MKKKYNLTTSQLRVLFEFDDQGNLVFTNKNVIWGHLKLNQEIDYDRLKKAINYCFKKNDSIRTKLCKEDDKLYQYFEDYREMNFDIVDVKSEDDVKKLLNDFINKPFEMFNSFLFRLVIYRYKNNYGGVMIKLNHVMGDGYTLGLFSYEVLGYYNREVDNYILKEEFFITIIGILVGLFFGTLYAYKLIDSIEINTMQYIKSIHLDSYIQTFIFMIIFGLIVSIGVHFALKKINLIESLKSVE